MIDFKGVFFVSVYLVCLDGDVVIMVVIILVVSENSRFLINLYCCIGCGEDDGFGCRERREVR